MMLPTIESDAGRTGRAARSLLATMAVTAAVPVAHSAQDAIEEVVVTGITEGIDTYTTTSVSTSTKLPLSIRETPQSISVITRQLIDDRNLKSLDDALAQSTGVTFPSNGTGGGLVFARGFQIDTFQVDGIPMTSSGVSFNMPDLAAYDHIEVVRGSNGLSQGSGNPSAAVNLIRKRPTDDVVASVNIAAGSWEYLRSEVDVGGPLVDSGRLRARGVATYEDRNYFVDVAESNKHLLYGLVEFDVTEKTLLTAGVNTFESDATPFVLGSPRYTDGRSLDLPRSKYLVPAWNYWDVEQTQLFASLQHAFNNGWSVKLSTLKASEESQVKRTAVQGPVDPALGRATRSSIYSPVDYDWLGGDLSVSGPVSLFGRAHRIVLGASYRDLSYDRGLAFLPAATIDVFNADPWDTPEPPTPPLASNATTDLTQTGVYAAAHVSFTDRLKFIVGARVDRWKLNIVNSNYATGAVTVSGRDKTEDAFTPYAGLVFDLNRTWSLYASYADIFQPQLNNFTALGEPIDPLAGASYEGGVKGEFYDGALNASLAVFYINQDNRAQEDPDHLCLTAPVSGWCYLSAGKVSSEGVEAEIAGRLARNWQMVVGYTFNTTEYERDRTASGAPTANQGQPFFTLTPKHIFRLWTTYRLPGAGSSWTLGGGLQGQSDFYTQQGSIRGVQGEYVLVNMVVGYDFNKHLIATLSGNNLLDKKYYTNIGISQGNVYGDPRNAMLTVRYKF